MVVLGEKGPNLQASLSVPSGGGRWEKHALTSTLSEAPFRVLWPPEPVASGLKVHFQLSLHPREHFKQRKFGFWGAQDSPRGRSWNVT